jgi:hypothetical protein
VAGLQAFKSCSSPELSLLGKVTFLPEDGVSKRRANGGAVIGDLEAANSVVDCVGRDEMGMLPPRQ